ncbi:MAG: matrixin family metalloprotease [Candidatus Daviesbacteria bacterium]|nr:matrixin family metalloprotease [Candidatus Daviesbacteria bacterium]
MSEKIISFILMLVAGLLVNLPIDFNKYDLPPTLSYYIRTLAPCAHPIYYKIGVIDPKFNIKNDDVVKDAQLAVDIWNKAAGKRLFVYDPKGTLAVNLVYDERQSISTQIQAKETQLEQAKTQISPNEEKYNNLVADFKKRLTALNTQIDYWNNNGGAPPEQYQKLVGEQAALKIQAEEINSLAAQLNLSAKEYNNIVSQLNQSATNFNSVIQDKPEEGLFSPARNEIDIYVAIDKNELIHTLAHEFGHSLGLPHTQDKKSIMNALTSKTTIPAKEDISALNNLCYPTKSK